MSSIVGDIGGTNSRFAYLQPDGALEDPLAFENKDFAGIEDALRAYLERTGRPAPTSLGLAVAAAVTGDHIRFLNSPWHFSQDAIRSAFGLETLHVLNDFSALALSLPSLNESAGDLAVLSTGMASPHATRAVLGPGTGLGVSGLIPAKDGTWAPIAGEGGHIGFAPNTAREVEIMRHLAAKFGRCSVERLISGQGLENIYATLLALDGLDRPTLRAAEISALGREASDAVAQETLDIFCAVLGSFAGDVALMLGAYGGIYLGGGIVPRILDVLRASQFLPRFHQKAPAAHLTLNIPIYAIVCPFPTLIGVGTLLNRSAARSTPSERLPC
jgi:glucokinase